MTEFLSDLLIAVITAAVPVLTAYGVSLLRKAAANMAAKTEDVKTQGYIYEITKAISDAVAATSQTYVDTLKNKGEFTVEAQKEAAQKALTVCLAAISPAAQEFIKTAYGDVTGYLATKIEAEVRTQKGLPQASTENTKTEATSVAASTAAATAAAIAQTAVQQLNAEPTLATE